MTPVCDAAANRCVQCNTNAECSGATPICDGNACRACRADGDCGAGIVNAFYAVKESVRMLSVPKVAVIEFYNAALDHYFIAAESQPDVWALDSGAIPGWARTGRTFKAYAGA